MALLELHAKDVAIHLWVKAAMGHQSQRKIMHTAAI